MAAGVVALMLDANPDLGWRDVQGVIIDSVTPLDPKNDDWQVNGAGHNVSHRYGFGLMDAGRAVQLSKAWKVYKSAIPLASLVQQPRVDIEPGQSASRTFRFTPQHVPAEHSGRVSKLDDLLIEHVEVRRRLRTSFLRRH